MAGGESVLQGVLHQRLQEEAGQQVIHGRGIDGDVGVEPLPVAHAGDLEVQLDEFDLLPHRNERRAGAAERQPKEIGHASERPLGFPDVHFHQLRHGIEGVEEEMGIELHTQRLELCARELLLERGGGPVAFSIAAHEFHHVRGADHRPVQDDLEIEMVHEHHTHRERVAGDLADGPEYVIEPGNREHVDRADDCTDRDVHGDPGENPGGVQLDPIDEGQHHLRPESPQHPRGALPQQGGRHAVVGARCIPNQGELQRREDGRNDPDHREEQAREAAQANAFVGNRDGLNRRHREVAAVGVVDEPARRARRGTGTLGTRERSSPGGGGGAAGRRHQPFRRR